MYHDRGPPPAAPCHQEHGLPEVLQHGAVSLHALRATRGAHGGPRRPGQGTRQVQLTHLTQASRVQSG